MGIEAPGEGCRLRYDRIMSLANAPHDVGAEPLADALLPAQDQRYTGLLPRPLHHVGEPPDHITIMLRVPSADVVAHMGEKQVTALASVWLATEAAPEI